MITLLVRLIMTIELTDEMHSPWTINILQLKQPKLRIYLQISYRDQVTLTTNEDLIKNSFVFYFITLLTGYN